jgi:hypothetical protein
MNDILAKHSGIIYQSPSYWGTGIVKFIVIKQLEFYHGDIMVKIKLLDRPNYRSSHFSQLGYAKVSLKGIQRCTIVEDNRNITEYLKARLLLFQ